MQNGGAKSAVLACFCRRGGEPGIVCASVKTSSFEGPSLACLEPPGGTLFVAGWAVLGLHCAEDGGPRHLKFQ